MPRAAPYGGPVGVAISYERGTPVALPSVGIILVGTPPGQVKNHARGPVVSHERGTPVSRSVQAWQVRVLVEAYKAPCCKFKHEHVYVWNGFMELHTHVHVYCTYMQRYEEGGDLELIF